MAYVTLKLLTSRGYEHMWTLVINSGTFPASKTLEIMEIQNTVVTFVVVM